MKRLILLALSGLIAPFTPVIAQHEDHAMHMPSNAPTVDASTEDVPPEPAPGPTAPSNHAADAYYNPQDMARARAMLRHESGGMPNSKLMIDRLEFRPGASASGYAWELEGWTGGDIDRLYFKSEGEGGFDRSPEQIEVHAGWLHALDPWFNLKAGVRQDFQRGPRRTHAVIAIEGLAPYWFDVEGQIFLSNNGEVTARAEASYDQRITQSLILQPAAEANLSAQDMPALATGGGLTSIELGLRLRYEIVREFAPYIGVNWERKLGRTARYVHSAGEKPGSLRFVAGLRLWF